jgi:hypothetical protein
MVQERPKVARVTRFLLPKTTIDVEAGHNGDNYHIYHMEEDRIRIAH